jgi:hypothetical protein
MYHRFHSLFSDQHDVPSAKKRVILIAYLSHRYLGGFFICVWYYRTDITVSPVQRASDQPHRTNSAPPLPLDAPQNPLLAGPVTMHTWRHSGCHTVCLSPAPTRQKRARACVRFGVPQLPHKTGMVALQHHDRAVLPPVIDIISP